MSVAVCCASLNQPILPVATSWLSELAKPILPLKSAFKTEEKKEKMQSFEFWDSIQSKKQNIISTSPPPYIHPLMQRSSIAMSLETCTESLGSETGSDEFTSGDELHDPFIETEEDEEEAEEEEDLDSMDIEKRDLFYVNYHCSIGRRSRTFPPPLPSISRRDGPCFKMQPRRHEGRLVVEAVPVPSVNYLHAERRGGRLLLSFVDNNPRKTFPFPSSIHQSEEKNEKDDEEEDVIMEEEEVEVVDRGTMVEVKVSTQAAVKFHRSSLVINKFVVGSRAAEFGVTRTSSMTTTAAAAAVAASSMSTLTSTNEGFRFNYLNDLDFSGWGPQSRAAAAVTEAKLLFASKRRSWEELLHDMRWCTELRRPLFIYEQPHCIAT